MDRRGFVKALGALAFAVPLAAMGAKEAAAESSRPVYVSGMVDGGEVSHSMLYAPFVCDAVGVENEIRCTGHQDGWKTYECTGRQRYLFANGSAGEWQAGRNLFTALVSGGQ